MGCTRSELRVIGCGRELLQVQAASSRLVAERVSHGWNLTQMRICWIHSSSPDLQQDFAATFFSIMFIVSDANFRPFSSSTSLSISLLHFSRGLVN